MDYLKAIDSLITKKEALDLRWQLKEELENNYKEDGNNDTKEDILSLINKIDRIPTVDISAPFFLGRKSLEKIAIWFRENLGKQVLISFNREVDNQFKIKIFFAGHYGEF
jgi:hypothetical protein